MHWERLTTLVAMSAGFPVAMLMMQFLYAGINYAEGRRLTSALVIGFGPTLAVCLHFYGRRLGRHPVTSDDLVGYRFAYVHREPGSGSYFGPLRSGHSYFHVDATARCLPEPNERWRTRRLGNHRAANPACACGFYSLRRPGFLGLVGQSRPCFEDGDSGWGRVRLQVSLGGNVVVHDLGYRAERQRVLRVEFERICVLCDQSRPAKWHRRISRQADGLAVDGSRLFPVCSTCCRNPWPLGRLANELQTEVAWAPKRFIA